MVVTINDIGTSRNVALSTITATLFDGSNFLMNTVYELNQYHASIDFVGYLSSTESCFYAGISVRVCTPQEFKYYVIAWVME